MTEIENSAQFTGVASVHFVAAYLSYKGLHAVPTTRNVKDPDILISTMDGASSLTLQVKTTSWAVRTRGRGDKKAPNHYEWDIGWSSARLNLPNLFFALVDLKEFTQMPDIFFLPSSVIAAYFAGGNPETWIHARYRPWIETIEPYRNNWELLRDALGASHAGIDSQHAGHSLLS